MKNISYILLLVIALISCDDAKVMDYDIDADGELKFLHDKTLITNNYTLTDDDYALSGNESVQKYKNFSATLKAGELIPELLTNMKLFGEVATDYTVNYNYYKGHSVAYSNYRKNHEVSADEYTAIGGAVSSMKFFNSNTTAAANANNMLKAAHGDAVKGDVYRVVAKEANKGMDAGFLLEMVADDYQIIVEFVKADDANKELVDAKYKNNEYYYGANSYKSNFDARLDKWKAHDQYKTMSDDDLKNLISDRQTEALLKLLPAKYPDATILDADGKELIYVIKYVVYNGSYDKVKYVRFKCTKDGPNPEFARVGSVYVNYFYEFYMFDGTDWAVESDIYRLSSDDYDLMGPDSGYPGKYNNFDASMNPDRFLPTWLKSKWAYEAEGTTKIVSYLFYNSGDNKEKKAVEYVFENGEWKKPAVLVSNKGLFTFKDRTWLFVPPIKFEKTEDAATKDAYELKKQDYALVGNGKYNNFDVREGKGEADEAVLIAKLAKIIKANFEFIVGDVFEISYTYYDGAAKTGTVKLKAVADE